MTLEIYGFEDAEGIRDNFTTDDYDTAAEYARKNQRALLALQYEYVDSELVLDFTPEGYKPAGGALESLDRWAEERQS